MMLKLPKFGRMKAKYNPVPNARERRHHARLMAMPCACCGKQVDVIVHHLLSDAPGKRWRRDHELVVPLNYHCHIELHADGDEWAWCMARGFDPVTLAVELRDMSKALGYL